MARSQYIYLIHTNASGTMLGAFTVKHEANSWADLESRQPLEHMRLTRMEDGIHGDKTETPVPWDIQRGETP